jgi:RNA polymerase sigma-70 factor (ECF subfamily)
METLNHHTLLVQQLFVQHHSALKAFVLSLWPNVIEADDVLQETFMVVTNKAHEFQSGSNFLSWSRSIARFEVLSARRKKMRLPADPAVWDTLLQSCPEDFANKHKLAALTQCMAALGPKGRDLLRLRYDQGHGPSEIAQLLSRNVNSINATLAKLRTTLRACVDRQLQIPERS